MAQTTKSKVPNKEFAKMRENPLFALIESFRNLSANIGFAVPKKSNGQGRTVCISSSVSSEGKTTVSVNLAVSCAGAGYRTVLIDCDMRKPSVHRFFSLDHNHKGLVEYLSGQAELNEVLAPNVSQNLDVISGRKSAPNPLLLIKNERFSALLEKMASEYDYVIIDTPPLGIVADALTIAGASDGLILVTRQMVSTYPLIRQVVSDIDFAGVNFLGFVLNDCDLKSSGRNYYNKYSYGYGDSSK